MRASLEIDEERLGCVECNIRKEDQVHRMVDATLHKFGRIDGLVNNGGGKSLLWLLLVLLSSSLLRWL